MMKGSCLRNFTCLIFAIYISSIKGDHVELHWSDKTNGQVGSPTVGRGDPVVLHCGGKIDLLETGATVTMDYKFFSQYENDEGCLWTLAAVNATNCQLCNKAARITLLEDGFESGNDGVTVFTSTIEEPLLTSRVLQRDMTVTFNAHLIFLGFASDSSNQGTGFRLRIDVIYLWGSSYVGDSFPYSSVQGRHSLDGPYEDYELVSIVVNPYKSKIVFGVDYVDIESGSNCTYDSLNIYEIGRLGDFTRKSKLCGHSEFLTGVFETNYPVLAYFTSNEANHDFGGFKISWNESLVPAHSLYSIYK